MQPWKIPNSQSNLETEKAGGITLSDFRLYYKAIVIRTVLHWYKNRQIKEQNKEHKNKSMCICGQLVYNKGGKTI